MKMKIIINMLLNMIFIFILTDGERREMPSTLTRCGEKTADLGEVLARKVCGASQR